MSQLRNRKQAKEAGLNTYFTGKPCKRGGIAERRLNGDCLCDACVSFTKQLKNDWAVTNKHKSKEWQEANPEKMKAYKNAWADRNRESQRDRLRLWKLNNKEKVFADFHKRRAAKINAKPCWFSEFDSFVIQEAFRLAKQRQVLTSIKWHVDHMIPLQAKTASGFHSADNIQVIPEFLNVRKANRMTYTERNEWLQTL